eukprot:m.57639 g.57639  ORF g.57639 m.57639 type:complete len:243 (+) comp13100_c0_seq2:975-1703(+)
MSPKGDVLQQIDTQLSSNYWTAVSDCGSFFGCSGFTPGIKIWTVHSDHGHFVQAERAMSLAGHTTGTVHFCFNKTTTMVASVAKNGTWACFNINVRWKEGEDCRLLSSGTFAEPSQHARVAIGSTNHTLAVASGQTLQLFAIRSSACLYTIREAHLSGYITNVLFDLNDDYVLTSGMDRRVNIWRNLPTKVAQIEQLREDLKTAKAETVKERIRLHIQSLAAKLKEANFSLPSGSTSSSSSS